MSLRAHHSAAIAQNQHRMNSIHKQEFFVVVASRYSQHHLKHRHFEHIKYERIICFVFKVRHLNITKDKSHQSEFVHYFTDI